MTAAHLLELGAATLGECGAAPLATRIRPVWPGARLAGPVRPVRCAGGDNLAIHAALVDAPAGSVLVVEVPSHPEHGYWGEVLTVAAQARDVAGLVIDACVRDGAALEARRFPVFATGRALPGAGKDGPGSIGAPVTVGDLRIGAGDWVVADDDGVVVIEAVRLDAVLGAARARADREAELFERLAAGATTVELLGLDTGPVEGASPT